MKYAQACSDVQHWFWTVFTNNIYRLYSQAPFFLLPPPPFLLVTEYSQCLIETKCISLFVMFWVSSGFSPFVQFCAALHINLFSGLLDSVHLNPTWSACSCISGICSVEWCIEFKKVQGKLLNVLWKWPSSCHLVACFSIEDKQGM